MASAFNANVLLVLLAIFHRPFGLTWFIKVGSRANRGLIKRHVVRYARRNPNDVWEKFA